MKIASELLQAEFVRRLNRFAIQVKLFETEISYLPNPGRLRELLIPGVPLLLEKKHRGERKTCYDAIFVRHGKIWVCIDSRMPNRLIGSELRKKRIPEFNGYAQILGEYRFGGSRLDFLLRNRDDCLLEIKGCTLVRKGTALFPDAPTERGTRHLRELMKAVREGYRACIFFLIQRPDAGSFAANASTDPKFRSTLRDALRTGVEAIAYTSSFRKNSVQLGERIPVRA